MGLAQLSTATSRRVDKAAEDLRHIPYKRTAKASTATEDKGLTAPHTSTLSRLLPMDTIAKAVALRRCLFLGTTTFLVPWVQLGRLEKATRSAHGTGDHLDVGFLERSTLDL